MFKLFIFGLSTANWALEALLLQVLWRWFLVPLGAPQLRWAHTMGLLLLPIFWTSAAHGYQLARQLSTKDRLNVELTKPIIYLMVLGYAWIIQLLM